MCSVCFKEQLLNTMDAGKGWGTLEVAWVVTVVFSGTL